MLKKLRNKKTAKKIWIILAILILPAFLLWGSGSTIRDKEKTKQLSVVGKISGRNVEFEQYQDAIEATRAQAIMQFGEKFSEIQRYINLESQAWDRLVLLSEAKKRRIYANDNEVIELIQSYPFLQRTGKFDEKTYADMLRYVFRAQPRIFEEQTRQNIILSKLFDELTKNIKVSDDEVKKEYTKINEQISVYYIAAIPFDFIDKDAPIDEKEIKDYFSENALQYKQPLSYNLEYISADSKDKIESLRASLNDKEALDKSLKEMGLTVKETGLFPETAPIPGIGFYAQIVNSLSKIKVGEYLSPTQIEKNYYLFKLKERIEARVPELAQIKDKVKNNLLQSKAEITAKNKIEECLEKLKKGTPPDTSRDNNAKIDAETKQQVLPGEILPEFEKAASLFGLKTSSTEPFKHGSYIEKIGASDMFWEKITELKENETSGIIKLPSGFYIIKLKSRVPLDENKFKEEKPELMKQFEMRKKQEYFSKHIEELKKDSQLFQQENLLKQ